MKKLGSVLILLALILTLVPSYAAGGEMSISAANFKSPDNCSAKNDGLALDIAGYFGFSGVDLSGIESITVKAKCAMPYGSNGDTLAVVLDDPKTGEDIGYVVINSESDTEFTGNIKEVSGKHDVYFVSCYGKNAYNSYSSVKFNTQAVARKVTPVPDSAIIDNYADTWALTDSLGREAASYAEAGDVKTGDHYVGMFYWNWHHNSDVKPLIISQVIKEHPEAKDDYSSDVWGTGETWWAEPVLGFYSGTDYFVYRRHASWLANAGVDVLFFDYTNNDMTYIRALNVMLQAFHDARESGVDAPKLSGLFGHPNMAPMALQSFWFNFLGKEEYKDLWFNWEGKPLAIISEYSSVTPYITDNSARDQALTKKIYADINVRSGGQRNIGPVDGKSQWIWLENYPLHEWGKVRDDGRTESMTVGVSINHSYVYNYVYVGLASDEYTKGRAYTEGFGEGDDPRSGAFFREQTSQVLDVDPAIVLIDGWNEFSAIRQQNYAGFKNSFVDTYDDENSRDIEPVKGLLKDDVYVMLVDFVRKYKGVRPAPVSGGRKTIDISGDAAQWSSVTPEYINDYDAYERTDKGQGEVYEGKTVNSVKKAKTVRDDGNVYFYVECRADITTETNEFLHLYINSDRNYMTGWEGYDYAVNRTDGAIERYENGAWVTVGKAEYAVSGNALQLKASAELLNIGSDFEFKWVDSSGEIASGDILDLYKTGSVAPMGRFNYVYTENEETTLDRNLRSRLYGAAVFKAGSNEMTVSGGRMSIYADKRVTAFEADGTLYIPYTAFEDIMYGESKAEYDSGDDTLHLACFDLDLGEREIKDEIWMYSVLGSLDARVNGRVKTLTHAATVKDGIIYIPVTYFSDCFGFDLYSENGIYAVSRYGKVETADVLSAAAQLD